MRRIVHAIDLVNERAGSLSSWLVAILIVLILYEVISRYVFNVPTTWGFGTFRMLGSAIIVLGWAYAQLLDSHVRVDVFYLRLSPRQKALIDVIGAGLFFFPVFTIFVKRAVDSMWHALLSGQFITPGYFSTAPPLPLLHKALIVIGLCLFFLQFGARFTRDVYLLAKGRPL